MSRRARSRSSSAKAAAPPLSSAFLKPGVKRAALGLVLVVYASVGTWFQFDFGEIMGYYTMFAEGLLDGRLSIHLTPAQVNLVDMIPFEGRYYLQWGPFPGLLHLIPKLFGLSLTDRAASILAAWLGGWVFLEIVSLLAVRHFSTTPRWLLLAFYFAYALATPAALTAYRGTVYNESISIGATGALFGFYCLLRAQRDASWRWPLLSGLALAAAVATRVTLALYAAVFLPAWAAVAWRRKPSVGAALAPLTAYCLPIVCGVALMLAYNAARFGSPFDYGNSYKPGATSHFAPFSLARIPENLGHYLFSLPRVSGDFPWLEHEGRPPVERVSRAEAMSSIVLASPFLLFAAFPVLSAIRRRKLDDLTLLTATAAVSSLGMFAVLLAFSAASRRYVQDFGPLLMVVAFIGAAMVVQIRGGAPRWWKAAACLAVLLSSALHAQIAFVQSFRTPTPDLNASRLLIDVGPSLRAIVPGPELAREEAVARNDWATVLLRRRRFAEAVAQLRVAAELLPDSDRIQKNLRVAEGLAQQRSQ